MLNYSDSTYTWTTNTETLLADVFQMSEEKRDLKC